MSKAIFLYGPPAVGKLTVAKLISEKLGIKIFHNHCTVDMLKPFFDIEKDSFWEINRRLRMIVFEEMFKETNDFIFTFCFVPDEDAQFIKDFLTLAERNDAKVKFVHLTTNIETLKERCIQESRKEHGKIKCQDKLSKTCTEFDFMTPISGVDSLELDNTNSTPEETTEKIIEHFNL